MQKFTIGMKKNAMSSLTRRLLPVLVALLTLVFVQSASALQLIDSFDENPQNSDIGTPCSSAGTGGADMLGGYRDIFVTRTSGAGTVVADVDASVSNSFSLSIGASTRGTALIQWDGNDGSCALNATGLGGINLNPDDGLAVHVRAVDLNGVLTMRVYTSAVNYSTFSYTIPTSIVAPGQVLYFPFEQFVPTGAGANFSSVGAVELLVDGTGIDSLDMTLDFVNSDLTRDFGDLPAAYNNITLESNNGARHIIDTTYLGVAVDADPNGQPSGTANVDTNDNGVVPVAGNTWGDGAGQLNVTATFPAGDTVSCFVGWIDWNGNGSFDVGGTTGGVSERVVNAFVFNGSSAQNITTPTVAAYGGTYPATLNARFRLFPRNNPLFTTLGLPLDGFGCPTGASEAQIAGLLTGLARGGEVEDYQWGFAPTAVTLANANAQSQTGYLVVLALVGVFGLGLLSFATVQKRR